MTNFSRIARTSKMVKNFGHPESSTMKALKFMRTRVAVEAILSRYNIHQNQLAVLVSNDTQSGLRLIRRWRSGDSSIGKSKQKILLSHFPEMKVLLGSPIWDLLTSEPWSSAELEAMFLGYYEPNDCPRSWTKNIPLKREVDIGIFEGKTCCPVLGDEVEPYYRNDIHGFTLLIFYYRIAIARRDFFAACSYLEALMNSLPALCRFSPLRKFSHEIIMSVEQLKFLDFNVAFRYALDADLVLKQIEAEEHITRRELQPRDPRTKRFLGPEKPCIVIWQPNYIFQG